MCTEPMSVHVHDTLTPPPPPDKKHRNQGDNQASHLMSCFTTCTNTITSNVCVTQKGTTVLAPTPVLQSFVWDTHSGSILGTMHLSLHTILPCTSVSTPYCHANKLKWVCITSVPFVHISPKAALHMLVHSLVFFIQVKAWYK